MLMVVLSAIFVGDLRLTLTRTGALSPHYGNNPSPDLALVFDPFARSHRPLGWCLESHWHVEERTQQTARLVHLPRHLQHPRPFAHHLHRVVPEGPQPDLRRRRGGKLPDGFDGGLDQCFHVSGNDLPAMEITCQPLGCV